MLHDFFFFCYLLLYNQKRGFFNILRVLRNLSNESPQTSESNLVSRMDKIFSGHLIGLITCYKFHVYLFLCFIIVIFHIE